ncbi:MAG: GntR family transcriptional regulator [Candidatus Omnitrophota bacterium]
MQNNLFLYDQVKSTLLNRIAIHKWQDGEQIPAEPVLCQNLGVSRVTLRRAIDELCAKGLLKKLHGKGTFVSSGVDIKRTDSKIWKAILLDDSIYHQVLSGMEDFAHKHDYAIIFANGKPTRLETQIKRGKENNVAGYLIRPSLTGDLKNTANRDVIAHLSELRNKKIPLVLINRILKRYKFDAVGTDNSLGGFLATKHLVGHGFNKIAYLSLPSHYEDRFRLQGYQVAMKAAKKVQIIKKIDYTEKRLGYKAARELLRDKKPQAVFAFNDQMATQVFWAARELGLTIPEDIAVVGYDDQNAIFTPSIGLTSINQSLFKIGYMASELLLKRIKGDWSDFPIRIRVKPTLVIRESCGCRDSSVTNASSE